MSKYQIDATWRVEPISRAILGEKFLGVLETISKAVPSIENWFLSEPPYEDEFLTIAGVRANIADWVQANEATTDFAPDPEAGYTLIAMNMKGGFSPKNIGVTARIGARFGDSITFRVGFVDVPSDLDTVTYPLFRTALLAIVAQLSPAWANARLYMPGYNDISLVPDVPPHPKSSYHRPWLSYLCAPLTKGLSRRSVSPASGRRTAVF